MRSNPDRRVVFALLAIAGLCVVGLGASLYRSVVVARGEDYGDYAVHRALVMRSRAVRVCGCERGSVSDAVHDFFAA